MSGEETAPSVTLREVSEASGLAPGAIRGGMADAGTEDIALGAGYAMARGLAVKIRGDRHAWNLGMAHFYAGRIRALVEAQAGEVV